MQFTLVLVGSALGTAFAMSDTMPTAMRSEHVASLNTGTAVTTACTSAVSQGYGTFVYATAPSCNFECPGSAVGCCAVETPSPQYYSLIPPRQPVFWSNVTSGAMAIHDAEIAAVTGDIDVSVVSADEGGIYVSRDTSGVLHGSAANNGRIYISMLAGTTGGMHVSAARTTAGMEAGNISIASASTFPTATDSDALIPDAVVLLSTLNITLNLDHAPTTSSVHLPALTPIEGLLDELMTSDGPHLSARHEHFNYPAWINGNPSDIDTTTSETEEAVLHTNGYTYISRLADDLYTGALHPETQEPGTKHTPTPIPGYDSAVDPNLVIFHTTTTVIVNEAFTTETVIAGAPASDSTVVSTDTPAITSTETVVASDSIFTITSTTIKESSPSDDALPGFSDAFTTSLDSSAGAPRFSLSAVPEDLVRSFQVILVGLLSLAGVMVWL